MDALSFALACPKAELHIHIEGSLEPELAFELARRNKVDLPYADTAALRAAYDFKDLQSFLDLYYACSRVLVTEYDFHDLMLAYLERAHAEGVVRAEVFFDPQTHMQRGVEFETLIDGLWSGAQEAERRHGISTGLIMCFLRHLPEESALDTLKVAEPWLDRIIGFGLDSSEKGHPPSNFVNVFKRCRDLGKHIVAHAGEEGPPGYISEALDLLHAERIDHGVRAVEDAGVLARLARERVPLTVCPLSNTKLCVFPSMDKHVLPQLLAAGANVTINCDDPAYFGGYLVDNIRALQNEFDWDIATWYAIARNSIEASFAEPAQKAVWISRLDQMLHSD